MQNQEKNISCSDQAVQKQAAFTKRRSRKKRLSSKENLDDFFAKMKHKKTEQLQTQQQKDQVCQSNQKIKRHLILTEDFLAMNNEKLEQSCKNDPFLKRQAFHFYKSNQKNLKKTRINMDFKLNLNTKLQKINYRIDNELKRVQSLGVLKRIKNMIEVENNYIQNQTSVALT